MSDKDFYNNEGFPDDPFNLNRFLSVQEIMYPIALKDLKNGKKRSAWMWFIFPQMIGLGYSSDSIFYGIRSIDEARAYLRHPVLSQRLKDCCNAMLSVQGKTAEEIMEFPDNLKLCSSMTLFSIAEDSNVSVFNEVLKKFFGNRKDQTTIHILNKNNLDLNNLTSEDYFN